MATVAYPFSYYLCCPQGLRELPDHLDALLYQPIAQEWQVLAQAVSEVAILLIQVMGQSSRIVYQLYRLLQVADEFVAVYTGLALAHVILLLLLELACYGIRWIVAAIW